MIINMLTRLVIGSSITEAVIDGMIRDKVHEPEVGGVVYCDLAAGYAEHSGIYMGDGEIMHRDGRGVICRVTAREFLAKTPGRIIYTSCYNTQATGFQHVADTAEYFEKTQRGEGYALLWRNCHIFSSACMTEDEENSDTFLWMLKSTAKEKIMANTWRIWDR